MSETVIEKGDDADGHVAAALCRESAPNSEDREVIKTFYVNPWLIWTWNPVFCAQRWAKKHDYGSPPVIEAFYVL